MTAPTVFISYSHKDEEWKDRLVTHLGVLEKEGLLDLWDDRKIGLGDDWRPEIEKAIERADIAILLISANFLTSNFILDEEVPKFLARREKKGMRIFPLIVKPCAWTEVKWLSKIQARPKDGKPLSTRRAPQADSDLAAFAKEIAGIVRRSETREVLETSRVWRLPPDKISLAKLPSTDPTLFGRDERLKELNAAWENPKINIVSLVAWGGVGKTALVNRWLSGLGESYGGAERVYGWSFYSQGAREGAQTSADQFIAAALTWFGDPAMAKSAVSSWDKGERLAELIKRQRILLILDGMEPLQNPPDGEIRDKSSGLVSLLRELARQNPGLVVISSRLKVDDLKDFRETSVKEVDLESLSPKAGAEYLELLGVKGLPEELKQAVIDFGGHALALTLLGRYLSDVHEGDIRKRDLIPRLTDEEEKGGHAKRVMQAYEKWFEEKPELDLLCLMGLFDRPAEKGAIDALLAAPVIDGLTNKIQGLTTDKYKLVVKHLRKARLLAEQDPHEPNTIDCHPLLREHFGEKLKAENPKGWQQAHGRLHEYYKSAAKESLDAMDELALLYAAVTHGCQEGQLQKTLDEIYVERILRGNENYSKLQFGLYGADLSTLSNFFDLTWERLGSGLDENAQAFVLHEVGVCLQVLGRLSEAVQPLQIATRWAIDNKDWKHASTGTRNLSRLYLTLGRIKEATQYANQNIELSNNVEDFFTRIAQLTELAAVLHQAGYFTDAEIAFSEAEQIQKEFQPQFPLLYSGHGMDYTDLLLDQGKFEEVEIRTKRIFGFLDQALGVSLLDRAALYLALGSAYYYQFMGEDDYRRTQALEFLNRAVNGLRQSGHQHVLPRGLLARAEYYRLTGDLVKAQKDVDEAFTIATRGGMGLHLADCHLEFARLNVARFIGLKVEKLEGSNVETSQPANVPTDYLNKAREHLATAKEMINRMGYHRRDKEVQELEEQLKNL